MCNKIPVFVFAVALAGCQTTTLEVMQPSVLQPAQVTALQSAVRNALKDPASALFGDHKSGTNTKGGIVVCGLVNARNSFGGYTGPQPYMAMYLDGKFYVEAIGGVAAKTQAILSVCAQSGLAVG
jgi:hypothetical protein